MYRIFFSENLKVRDHLEDLGIDGKIILSLSQNKSRDSSVGIALG
jgi:hypothetical protein